MNTHTPKAGRIIGNISLTYDTKLTLSFLQLYSLSLPKMIFYLPHPFSTYTFFSHLAPLVTLDNPVTCRLISVKFE